MPIQKGSKRVYFPKVQEARDALQERALEIQEAYYALAAEAKAAGKFEVAEAVLWKLMDHMPKVDGKGIIDSPASKPKEVTGPIGPQIAIGIQLGGMTKEPKQIEAPVVEGSVVPTKDE